MLLSAAFSFLPGGPSAGTGNWNLTAMVQIVRQKMTRHDDARSLMRGIYKTEVDLEPDLQAKTLTVRIHPLANASSDEALRHLCGLPSIELTQ